MLFPRALTTSALHHRYDMEKAILELCCDADSGLGIAAPDFGFASGRITVAERFDLPRGVATALRFVA